jgi:hypothetical protein
VGRRCLCCDSLYEDEYSKLYGMGKKVSEILEYSRGKGDTFSYNSLVRHLKLHSRNKQVSNREDRDKLLKEELGSSVNIIRKLNKNLEVCSSRIDSLLEGSSPNSELLKFLGETRMTIQTLRNFMKDFNIKEIDQKEDIFNRMLYCMHDFPPDIIEKFSTRWNEYNSEKAKIPLI